MSSQSPWKLLKHGLNTLWSTPPPADFKAWRGGWTESGEGKGQDRRPEHCPLPLQMEQPGIYLLYMWVPGEAVP